MKNLLKFEIVSIIKIIINTLAYIYQDKKIQLILLNNLISQEN